MNASRTAVYVTTLHVDEIFADPTYQRALDTNRATTIAQQWDRRLAGILEVSDRGDGEQPRYAVVDGQHRWAAAKLLDDPPLMVAHIHEGLNIGQEAALFDKLNRQRKQPTLWDHWRARKTAGDRTVLAIEYCVATAGLTIGEQVKDGHVWCISTVEKIARADQGLDLGGSTRRLRSPDGAWTGIADRPVRPAPGRGAARRRPVLRPPAADPLPGHHDARLRHPRVAGQAHRTGVARLLQQTARAASVVPRTMVGIVAETPAGQHMTPLSFHPVTSVPCTVCGSPSVAMTSWPDGTYHACCPQHLDSPRQITLWVERA